MPRLLAIGHVTRDLIQGSEVLGGSAVYGALTARKLGWEAAVLTRAGADFDPERELPGVTVFLERSSATTKFRNDYDANGERRQELAARADDIELTPLADEWRDPDALLLAPVAGEIAGIGAAAFEAGVVGALAQGWLRGFDRHGNVSPRAWQHPERDLLGVHALFVSERDLPQAASRARELLAHVPVVVLTRGWQGLTLLTREGAQDVPGLPREEVDPTGAGDVFAAAFLLRYHESGDLQEAAAFAACAASCAVEAVGVSGLGDRPEVTRRLALRQRLIDEGDWDE